MTRQILPVSGPVASYWLSEPHSYADLRSTPSLPEKCGVAIIGAGLAGVLSAYHVLKNSASKSNAETGHQEKDAGPKVVLIDARQLCSGATGRNGGHIKVQVKTLLNLKDGEQLGGKARSDLQDYVSRVMLEIKGIVEEEELECEFELRRSFDVYTDSTEAEDMMKQYEEAREKGEVWTKNVSWVGERLVEQITSIKGAKGAFSVPAASFWPYKFVTHLLEVMVKRWPERLNVQMNTPITSLTTASSSSPPTNVLHTDRGPIFAEKVVLATNAYTAGLIPSFKHAITPVRGMASHHRPSKPIHPHLTNTYNINFGPSKGVDYLNPRPDGGIVVGGGAWYFAADRNSWCDNFDDAHLFPKHVNAYWHDYMPERFLGWEDGKSVNDYVWTGIMGRTTDGQPYVGRVPGRENEWVLAGFNGGGMAIIALCARAVGRMVCEGKDFGDVWKEEGLLEGFACSEGRLQGA
jgi:glycine/D-amino acid oxidase-like deaminating enzyme